MRNKFNTKDNFINQYYIIKNNIIAGISLKIRSETQISRLQANGLKLIKIN